jgi:hypothetical protein
MGICATLSMHSHPSRDGGTGRRSGLKIRRASALGGSTPPPGTIRTPNPFRFANFPAIPSDQRYSKPESSHAAKLNSGDFSEKVLDDRHACRDCPVLWVLCKADCGHHGRQVGSWAAPGVHLQARSALLHSRWHGRDGCPFASCNQRWKANSQAHDAVFKRSGNRPCF